MRGAKIMFLNPNPKMHPVIMWVLILIRYMIAGLWNSRFIKIFRRGHMWIKANQPA
jgi:hypothetical protein